MENLEQLYGVTEREPRMIDLFDSEVVQRVGNEGKIYIRKIEPIKGAEQVQEKRVVKTILPDGTIESEVETKPGDWIITGSKGEQFVFTNEKFESLYDEENEGVYIPKKRKIIALQNPFNEPIRIIAPWSTEEKKEYQDGNEKAMIVFSFDDYNHVTKDRYLIGDEEMLLSNYKESLQSYRHLKGNDEAVARVGSQEQVNKLVSIIQNPGEYSREELVSAVIENYSGEVYGNQHIEKSYEQWGGPDHGKKITTLYGEFREKYPHLAQLTLDPGFMNHLPDFMEMTTKYDFTSIDFEEARKVVKESLGTQEVYRGMSLSEAQVEEIRKNGIIASIPRHMPDSKHPTQKEFEAKVLSVKMDETFHNHFYGGANNSILISVSGKEDVASTLGETFGHNKEGNKKVYVVKMKIPVIELMYKEHAHKVEKEVESFVFWKINPEEITEIREVTEEELK